MRLRPLILALFLLLAACSQTPREAAQSKQPLQTYSLTGEVVRLDPSTQVAILKHDEIKDWMEAMTMGFPIKDKSEFEKLKPGQKLKAEVKVQGDDFWLEKIAIQP
jgi:Cu/Ag efflux protein CusF